jgi:hypothetical protein
MDLCEELMLASLILIQPQLVHPELFHLAE